MNCTPRGTLSRNKNKQQFLLEKKKSRNRTDFHNYTENDYFYVEVSLPWNVLSNKPKKQETQNNAAARKKIFETQTRVVQYGDQIPVMGGDRPQQGDETRRDERGQTTNKQ